REHWDIARAVMELAKEVKKVTLNAAARGEILRSGLAASVSDELARAAQRFSEYDRALEQAGAERQRLEATVLRLSRDLEELSRTSIARATRTSALERDMALHTHRVGHLEEAVASRRQGVERFPPVLEVLPFLTC